MKFGLFYQLPCAPGQSEAQRYEDTLEQIVHADRLGFDVAWLAELHFYRAFSIMPAPLMVAVALAARTRTIRFGTGVLLLPFHNPLRLVEEVATADLLTGGRIELGLGRGTIDVHFQGFDVPREESRMRFEEALELIERVWRSDERFNFEGRFHRASNVAVVPHPIQKPHPPIRLAANSVETAEFAGRRGFGIIVASPINPLPQFYEHARAYRRALAGGIRGDLAALFPTFVGDGRAAVRVDVEPSVIHYFHTIAAQARVGGGHHAEGSYAYLENLVAKMTSIGYDEIEREMAVYGSPSDCIERIRSLHDGGVDQLVCWFNPGGLVPHYRVMSAMERFAREVMPAFRQGLDKGQG